MFDRQVGFRFAFITLMLSALFFSGCEKSSSTSPGLASPANHIAKPKAESQAVKLYVDAMMLKDIQDWDQAIQKLNSAIEYAPDFSLAYSSKGDIYQLTKKYKISAEAYEKAVLLDPYSFKDFASLGKVRQILEDFPRAVKAYVSACELNTEDLDVHLGASRCYYELENFEMAFDYCQRAKEIAPENAQADLLMGDIYSAKADKAFSAARQDPAKGQQALSLIVDAILSYKSALKTQSSDPKTMIALAVAYTKQAAYSKPEDKKASYYNLAEGLLKSAIEKDPASSTAYQYLGLVQLSLYKEDLNLALSSYNKAVQVDQNDWMARKGLGVVYMLKYISLRKQAIQQDTLDQLDDSFMKKAMQNWDTSLSINPDQPELRALYAKFISQ